MGWKNLPYWLKGAIIGVIISLAPVLLMFVGSIWIKGEGFVILFPLILHVIPVILILENIGFKTLLPNNLLSGYFLYFFAAFVEGIIIGGIIGFIVGKVKQKSQLANTN